MQINQPCMYILVCVCICICICVYTHTRTHAHTHTHTHTHTYIYATCVSSFTVNRNREFNCTNKLWQLVPSGSGLEDIKLAIQQLTMRSHTSNTGYSTSTYSSLSGSESSEPAVRRLMRHSSLETINTNVTSADEFVWVDSHNRYVAEINIVVYFAVILQVSFQRFIRTQISNC